MSAVAPGVSVLMAVYNTPRHYLDEAIRSILSQSHDDFEFIIVDDGSNEETRSMLREYGASDPRVRLHSLLANVGLTRALNIGLRLARGTYVARQDADDLSHPRRLEETCRFMELHPELAAAGTDAVLIGPTGHQLGVMTTDPGLSELKRRNILVHGSMMFRREVFAILQGYDERMRLSQDYELYLRMIRKHDLLLGVVSEPLYSLRQHSGSLSSRKMLQQLYYSVLAKALTLPGNVPKWRRDMFLVMELIVDFVITHRLLLGPVVRRVLSSRQLAGTLEQTKK